MTQRVFVHVGPHKTGTTYIQGLLTTNHGLVAEQGMLFPRRTFRAQSRSIREVMHRGPVPKSGRDVKGDWKKLRRELDRWQGPSAVISHEMISSATDAHMRRLVKRLSGFDVHIIYTARDLSRVATAMWQTGLRSTQKHTWEEYARSLKDPDNDELTYGKRFWFQQGADSVLARWGKLLPHENLHLITVPRPGNPPELLWQRFCAVVGLDPSRQYARPPRSNPSLGTAESELIRRINEVLSGDDIPKTVWLSRTRWLGRTLEKREGMAKYTLPDEDLEWLSRRAEVVIAGLREGGYEVTGDLDDLVPQPVPPDQARRPSDTTPEAVLDVAVDVIRQMTIDAGFVGHEARADKDAVEQP